MLTKNDTAEFSWDFGEFFFLETAKGSFEWSDPEYGGDNTIRPFPGGYKQWCKIRNIPFARCKGKHVIESYCGSNVQIIQ